MAEGTIALELSDEIRETLAGALESGHVVTVAYVDDQGWPQLSPRGSVHVLGPQQLAMWARNPNGGLPQAIGSRPELTCFFMDLPGRHVVHSFFGRGHIADDPEVIEQVYEGQPDREKAQDPERHGVAIVVDLVRVVGKGMKPEQNFVMERDK